MPDLNPQRMAQIKQKFPEIYEVLRDHQAAINNIGQQTNSSPVGLTPAPIPHAALNVKGGGGILDVAITDNSPQSRGKTHFIEYADNASFTNAHVVSLGPSKNWRRNIGEGTFHVRSYAAYPTSGPSESVYHPPVSTSGAEPALQSGQGSGTGGGGYGSQPFTGSKVPIR